MAYPKRSLFAIPTAALAITLGLGIVPMPALGATSTELQQQLDSASEKLYSLYAEAEHANNDLVTVQSDLNKIQDEIKTNKAKISEEKSQLTELQGELSGIVSGRYKGDNVSLLSLVLNSENFGKLLANIRYANTISSHQQEVIQQTKELQTSLEKRVASLEKDEASQKKLVAEQKEKASAANAAASEAQSYYDSLSDELKKQIAAEEAAARKAALAEAQRQQQASNSSNSGSSSNSNSGGSSPNNNSGSGGGSSNGGGGSSSNNSGSGGSSSNNSGNGGNGGSGGSSSGGGSSKPSGPSSSASSFVARAQAVIGSGYSWSGYYWTGSTSSSWFTCSGLVDFALGLSTNTNSPESLYGQVNVKSSISDLKYGDLVFFASSGRWCGHVGIYVGNDTMIDSTPGVGVGYHTVSTFGGFIGGGTIV